MKVQGIEFIATQRFKKGRSRSGVQYEPEIAVLHWNATPNDAVALANNMVAPKNADGTPRYASYHFAEGRGGELVQSVDTEDTAWHAGDGALGALFGGNKQRVNERSIGICLCNRGPVSLALAQGNPDRYAVAKHTKRGFEAWEAYEKYTEQQAKTLLVLLETLKSAHATLRYVCGHQDVTRGKGDPGPLFDTLYNTTDLHIQLPKLGLSRVVHNWTDGTWAVLD